MDAQCMFTRSSRSQVLGDVQARLRMEGLAHRQHHSDPRRMYYDVPEALLEYASLLDLRPLAPSHTWFRQSRPVARQSHETHSIELLQQTVSLSPTEQDALDGLLLLHQQPTVTDGTAGSQNQNYPHYQTYCRHIRSVQSKCLPTSNSGGTKFAAQPRQTGQRSAAGRTFAAAVAAASRIPREYPIFVHHQPQRSLKASSARPHQRGNQLASTCARAHQSARGRYGYGPHHPGTQVNGSYGSHAVPVTDMGARAAHGHHSGCHPVPNRFQESQSIPVGGNNTHIRATNADNWVHIGSSWNTYGECGPGMHYGPIHTAIAGREATTKSAHDLQTFVSQGPITKRSRADLDSLAFAG
eukprot:jgi/Ulvmu1/8710/UM047_0050.1